MTTTEREPASARRRATVRTRFLAAALALSALGLAVAGVSAYALQRERLDDTIDESLARTVEEFRGLAAGGIDPRTGNAYDSVGDLLYVAVQRHVPAPNQDMIALVGGTVTWVGGWSPRLRLERDSELLAEAGRYLTAREVTIRSLVTPTRTYRYAAVPVQVAGDPDDGMLLLAVDRGAEHAELARTYRTYALVSVGALLATGVVGWLVTGRLLAPIRRLRRTAQQITETDLSARIPVTGNDDLSDLTRTVNAMLDRLDSAFASQRRLLDDVGHELRTR